MASKKDPGEKSPRSLSTSLLAARSWKLPSLQPSPVPQAAPPLTIPRGAPKLGPGSAPGNADFVFRQIILYLADAQVIIMEQRSRHRAGHAGIPEQVHKMLQAPAAA